MIREFFYRLIYAFSLLLRVIGDAVHALSDIYESAADQIKPEEEVFLTEAHDRINCPGGAINLPEGATAEIIRIEQGQDIHHFVALEQALCLVRLPTGASRAECYNESDLV